MALQILTSQQSKAPNPIKQLPHCKSDCHPLFAGPRHVSPRWACWLFGLLLAAVAGCREAQKSPTAPLAVEVTVARPLVRQVTDYEDFIGRTKAAEAVEVRSRVTGYLVKILFEDGDEVKRAQELFQIDPRPSGRNTTRRSRTSKLPRQISDLQNPT